MQQSTKAYVFAITAILFWSTVATAFKIALKGMSFANLLLISTLTSVIVLIIILLIENNLGKTIKSTSKQFLNSAILGFLNPFLYYMILLKAYSLLPAQIAQPLNYTWPVVLVILSAPFLGQKISLKAIAALLICLIGVFVISSQGKISLNIQNPLGIFLATGSSIIWAIFWLLNMKDKRQETQKLFLNFLFGTIYIIIYHLLFENIKIENSTSLIAAIYVGVFEMGITFVLWLTALRYASSPEKISSLVYLSPFLSIFFISFFLHENIHITTIFGLIFIVLGIILSKTNPIAIGFKKAQSAIFK